MNAREREVMVAALENCLSLRNAHPYSQTEAAASSEAFLHDYGSQLLAILHTLDALIADTRASTGEGVEAKACLSADPGQWIRNACVQFIEAFDLPYGTERSTKCGIAVEAMRKIISQPAQGGQGQQEAVAPEETVISTSDRDLFDRLRRSQRWCELASHDGNDEFAGLAYDLREAAAFVESAHSQTPPKEQGNDTRRWLSDEDVQAFCSTRSREQGQQREITDADIENACYEAQDAVGCTPWGNFSWSDESRKEVRGYVRRILEWYESTRAPQPHMTDAHAAKLEGLREASLRGIENDPFKD